MNVMNFMLVIHGNQVQGRKCSTGVEINASEKLARVPRKKVHHFKIIEGRHLQKIKTIKRTR